MRGPSYHEVGYSTESSVIPMLALVSFWPIATVAHIFSPAGNVAAVVEFSSRYGVDPSRIVFFGSHHNGDLCRPISSFSVN